MDLRVQRLDPAVEHFRKAGVVGDLGHGRPASFSSLAVPPVDSMATPRLTQRAREFDDAGLVGDADEGLFDGHRVMSV